MKSNSEIIFYGVNYKDRIFHQWCPLLEIAGHREPELRSSIFYRFESCCEYFKKVSLFEFPVFDRNIIIDYFFYMFSSSTGRYETLSSFKLFANYVSKEMNYIDLMQLYWHSEKKRDLNGLRKELEKEENVFFTKLKQI